MVGFTRIHAVVLASQQARPIVNVGYITSHYASADRTLSLGQSDALGPPSTTYNVVKRMCFTMCVPTDQSSTLS